MLRQQFVEGRRLRGQHLVFRRVLKIQAQQLLLAADHAQLDSGLELRIAAETGRDAGSCNQRFQLVAGLVVADHTQQRCTRADGHDVVSHIGRASHAFFLARDPHHRHRRLRRDPVHRAIPVTVQHGIANHQHPGLGELLAG